MEEAARAELQARAAAETLQAQVTLARQSERHALAETEARPSLIPPDARFPRAQGSSGATATVPFVWRGHTKSRATRVGRALELALRLG